MRIVEPSAMLVWATPNAEQQIEAAGRTCYKSEDHITPESAAPFIEMVCKRQHESVLEHAVASFRVVCDRGVSHEFVRHRIMSFSQESTRYCNYGKDKFDGEMSFIQPLDLNAYGHARWMGAMQYAEDAYLGMLRNGATPQIARSVLPNSLKTEFVVTCNFREWRHFLKLREAPTAHPQMRTVAKMIGDILRDTYPSVFKQSET